MDQIKQKEIEDLVFLSVTKETKAQKPVFDVHYKHYEKKASESARIEFSLKFLEKLGWTDSLPFKVEVSPNKRYLKISPTSAGTYSIRFQKKNAVLHVNSRQGLLPRFDGAVTRHLFDGAALFLNIEDHKGFSEKLKEKSE